MRVKQLIFPGADSSVSGRLAAPSTPLYRCLSVRQPWAWVIMAGFKSIENRCWDNRFRGTLAIHAGKIAGDYYVGCAAHIKQHCGVEVRRALADAEDARHLHFGAILGLVDVVDWVASDSPAGRALRRDKRHRRWADADSEFYVVVENPRALATPIASSGKLGLYFVTPDEQRLLQEIA